MEKKAIVILLILAVLYWLTKTDTYIDEATNIELKYHIKYTQDASSGDNLPIIIALHGNGDTYDNFYSYTLKDLQKPARIVLIEAPERYWPYDATQLKQYSTAIASMSDYLYIKYSSNKKPVLFGFSGGGVMAFYSALNQCESYSTIVSVSGMLKANALPQTVSMNNSCKVQAFHGEKDRVVGFSGGRLAVKELQKHSDNVEMTSFDGGHLGVFREQKKMILSKLATLL